MFIYQLKTTGGSTTLSATTTVATTQIFDLHNKRYDKRRLWLYLNINSGGSMCIHCAANYEASSVTKSFLPISMSGNTIQLRGGISVGGIFGNGKYELPLLWSRQGVSEPLTGIPYLRIGYIGFHSPVNFTGYLVIG